MYDQTNHFTSYFSAFKSLFRALAFITCVILPISYLNGQEETDEDEADEDLVELTPFEVSSERDQGYFSSNVLSLTRTVDNLIETPFTANILTNDYIEDVKVEDFHLLINRIVGVERSSLLSANFHVRGFDSVSGRNGFLLGTVSQMLAMDTAFIERVEVLKGPSSLLFGSSEPGGIVNFITKRPSSKPAYHIEQTFGQHDYFRTDADFTGPLYKNSDGSFEIDYRFVATFQSNESAFQFYEREKTAIFPSLTFRWSKSPEKQTVWTIDFWYVDDETRGDKGWMGPIHSADLTGFAFDIFKPTLGVGGGLGNIRAKKDFATSSFLTHSFNNWLSLRTMAIYTEVDVNLEVTFDDVQTAPGANTFTSFPARIPQQRIGTAFQTDALMKFDLGSEKKLNLTVGHLWEFSQEQNFFETTSGGTITYSLDPQPGDGTQPLDYWPRDWITCCGTTRKRTGSNSVYFIVDYTHPIGAGKLRLMGGGRQHYIGDFLNEDRLPAPAVETLAQAGVNKFTKQFGVSYILPNWTVFGNYSESFAPQGATQLGQELETFPPKDGKSFEFGAKFNTNEGKIAGSISYFDIELTNIAFFEPDTSGQGGFGRTLLDGLRTAKGVEFEFFLNPTPNWSMQFAYSFIDSAIAQSNAFPERVGQSLPNAPDNKLSLWTKYTFTEGPLNGFYVSGGYLWRDEMAPLGAGPEILLIRATKKLDMSVGYIKRLDEDKTVTLSFFVDNVTDQTYFDSYQSIGFPRTWRFSIAYDF